MIIAAIVALVATAIVLGLVWVLLRVAEDNPHVFLDVEDEEESG